MIALGALALAVIVLALVPWAVITYYLLLGVDWAYVANRLDLMHHRAARHRGSFFSNARERAAR